MSETPWIGRMPAAQRAKAMLLGVNVAHAIQDAERHARYEVRAMVVQLLLSELSREEAMSIIGKMDQQLANRPPEEEA